MTVTSTTAISGPYDGNDVTVTFDYTFYIADEDELKVTLTDEDGVDTVQTITTHYTVTISDDGTGTFTMVTAPATGEQVTATLDVDLTQETDLLNLGQFAAETHEDMADKLTRICQQQQEVLDRCLKLGQSSDLDPSDVTLANLAEQVIISTTNFAHVLTSADDTLQEALETLDSGFPLRTATLIAEETASDDATLGVQDSDLEDYDRFLVEIVGLRPATGSQSLCMEFSQGAGWLQAGYQWAWAGAQSNPGTTLSDTDSSETYGKITKAVSNTADYAVHGTIVVYNWSTYGRASFHTNWYNNGIEYADGIVYEGAVGGAYDGIRFYFTSGNITSGTIRVWGLPTGS